MKNLNLAFGHSRFAHIVNGRPDHPDILREHVELPCHPAVKTGKVRLNSSKDFHDSVVGHWEVSVSDILDKPFGSKGLALPAPNERSGPIGH
jgi:hypothetical protein